MALTTFPLASADDGHGTLRCLGETGGTWAAVRTLLVADNLTGGSLLGHWKVTPDRWVFRRLAIIFDTRSLAIGTPIYGGYIYFFPHRWATNAPIIVLQNGQPDYPHYPVVVGDYDLSHYGNAQGGSWDMNELPVNVSFTPRKLFLNANGISWIRPGNYTKFILRTVNDIDNVELDMLFSFTFSDNVPGFETTLNLNLTGEAGPTEALTRAATIIHRQSPRNYQLEIIQGGISAAAQIMNPIAQPTIPEVTQVTPAQKYLDISLQAYARWLSNTSEVDIIQLFGFFPISWEDWKIKMILLNPGSIPVDQPQTGFWR